MTIFVPPIAWNVGAAAITAIVKQAEATSTTSAINAPADIIAGDLLVLLDKAINPFGPATAVTPSGFTSIDDKSQTFTAIGVRQILSYKLATGSEASASLTGMNGLSANRKALLVFRPNVAATSITVADVAGEITANNPSAQTCNASGGAAPLVIIGAYGSRSTVNPRTFTVGGSAAKDGELQNQPGGDNNIALAWKIYNSSPADAVIDMDDEGDWNVLQSCYIQLA